MKEVFRISVIKNNSIFVLPEDFILYGDALEAIKKLPTGEYQIQKFFIV